MLNSIAIDSTAPPEQSLSGFVDFAAAEDEIKSAVLDFCDRLAACGFVDQAVQPDHYQGPWRFSLIDGSDVLLQVARPMPPEKYDADAYRMVLHATQASATVTRFFREAESLPFTDTEMARIRSELPITRKLSERYPDSPLAGLGVILTIHHMTDFLVLVETLLALGADPYHMTVIDKEYSYAFSRRVDAYLRQRCGIRVWRYSELGAGIADHISRLRASGKRSVIMDDGGYVIPHISAHTPQLLDEFVGLVEQTASGIWRIQGLPLPMPLFSVAESEMKGAIESYGIADAAVRNLLRLLPNEKFEGQSALVLGYGRIGSAMARILRGRRMRVAVYDREIARLVAAHEEGFFTRESLASLLRLHNPMVVFGCAGRGSMTFAEVELLTGTSYLVSTTSRDYEFPVAEIRAKATASQIGMRGTAFTMPGGAQVTAVANGFPINFHHAESLPNRYVDLVLAGLIVGAITIARRDPRLPVGGNVSACNEILAESGIMHDYYGLYGPRSCPG